MAAVFLRPLKKTDKYQTASKTETSIQVDILRVYLFLCIFFFLITACVPEEKNTVMEDGDSISIIPDNENPVFVCDASVFTADSSGDEALVWFIDGIFAGRGPEFIYKIDENRIWPKNYHLLSVTKAPFFLRNARSWILVDDPTCDYPQPDPKPRPDPQPSPKPDPKDCTADNSCEAGTLTFYGSGYGALEGVQGVTILSFADKDFDISLVSAAKGVAPSTQEGFSRAVLDSDGTLSGKFGDLTLVESDNQLKVLNGGPHLVVLVIDHAPAILDTTGRSDMGGNDLITYTTVVVDGNTTINVDYSKFEWRFFPDPADQSGGTGGGSYSANTFTDPAVPVGYDPFSGSCFIDSACLK